MAFFEANMSSGGGTIDFDFVQRAVSSPSASSDKTETFDGKVFACFIVQYASSGYSILGYYRETPSGFNTFRGSTGGALQESVNQFWVDTSSLRGGIKNLVYDPSTNKTTVTFSCGNTNPMVITAWIYK